VRTFQGGPPGRLRRQLSGRAYAPAMAPAPADLTPVGWREKLEATRAAADTGRGPGRGGFDKGTLAAALIGLIPVGWEASPVREQAYGPPPLVKSAAPSAQSYSSSPLTSPGDA
jgi:hypothetical protein